MHETASKGSQVLGFFSQRHVVGFYTKILRSNVSYKEYAQNIFDAEQHVTELINMYEGVEAMRTLAGPAEATEVEFTPADAVGGCDGEQEVNGEGNGQEEGASEDTEQAEAPISIKDMEDLKKTVQALVFRVDTLSHMVGESRQEISQLLFLTQQDEDGDSEEDEEPAMEEGPDPIFEELRNLNKRLDSIAAESAACHGLILGRLFRLAGSSEAPDTPSE
jgi:hypothetical protein